MTSSEDRGAKSRPGGAVDTWIHLTRFGTNVLEVAVWPRHHIARAGAVFETMGLTWIPVLLDRDGQPRALLLFTPSAFTDDDVAELVDRISESPGMQALAHLPFHDHEFGHTHLFRPAGSPPRDAANAPVFAQAVQYAADDEPPESPAGVPLDEPRIEVWLFGTHQPLMQVSEQMQRYFEVEVTPVEGPHGWTSAACTMTGRDAPDDYACIEVALGAEGCAVHVRPLQRPDRRRSSG
ncbi:hypothetical protein [Nocardioides ferulae]|uniref:hypothetical protein n=1 Tax=Nocardioides ferulae TaxID=2340821 RepID=UPI000EAFA2AE|nr:hypothetical protein [Nocardioides ferulae]